MKVASDAEEQGWCQFELMKHKGGSKEEITGLGIASESEGLKGLAAGIFHHAALLSLGTEEAHGICKSLNETKRGSRRLEGMIYGHALLAHISKEEGEFETVKCT